MADQPQAKKTAEKAPQPEAKPTSEQKTPEPVKTAEAPAKVAKPVEAEKERELPEDAKERTKEQFDKIKSNYRKEREKRIKLEQTFQQFQTKPQPQQKPVDDWYNQETGQVDVNKLKAREARRDAELNQLRQQVQGVSAQTQAQQEKELYVSYPELNPSGDQFDETFHKAVRGSLTTAYLDGENPNPKDVADAIMGIASKQTKQAEKEGAKKALEQLSPKEQAALEATGRSDRRLPERNLGSLQQATRKGGDRGINAIVERMKGIPPVGK